MKVYTTLEEVLNLCDDWDLFCQETGWDEYAVANGGGDVEVVLSIEEAKRYGVLTNDT